MSYVVSMFDVVFLSGCCRDCFLGMSCFMVFGVFICFLYITVERYGFTSLQVSK